MAKNSQKRLKMVRSGQKWPSVVKNGQKLLKLAVTKPKMSEKVLKYLLGLKGPMGLNVLSGVECQKLSYYMNIFNFQKG